MYWFIREAPGSATTSELQQLWLDSMKRVERGEADDVVELLETKISDEAASGSNRSDTFLLESLLLANVFCYQQRFSDALEILNSLLLLKNPEIEFSVFATKFVVLDKLERRKERLDSLEKAFNLLDDCPGADGWDFISVEFANERINQGEFEEARIIVERIVNSPQPTTNSLLRSFHCLIACVAMINDNMSAQKSVNELDHKQKETIEKLYKELIYHPRLSSASLSSLYSRALFFMATNQYRAAISDLTFIIDYEVYDYPECEERFGAGDNILIQFQAVSSRAKSFLELSKFELATKDFELSKNMYKDICNGLDLIQSENANLFHEKKSWSFVSWLGSASGITSARIDGNATR